jgi:hypothetical protein
MQNQAEFGLVRMIAAGAVGLGILLLLVTRRKRKVALGDDAVRSLLRKRGFSFNEFAQGWQAQGPWNGEQISVQWDSGYHAGRFGRAWVLVVIAPGAPLDPLPLPRDQVVLVETGTDGFTVVLPEAGIASKRDHVAARIDAVLAARR